MRESAVIYRSFFEAIKELPEVNQAEIWNAICEYSFNFKVVELTGISKTVFTLIRPQIEANIKRYNNGTMPKHKQTGSKTEAKQKQTKSKSEANANVNVNVNDSVNDNVTVNVSDNVNVKDNDFFSKKKIELVLPFNSDEFKNMWITWKQYKKEQHRYTYKAIGEQAALKKLADLANGNEQIAIDCIMQSIENGWKGLFNLKQNSNGQQSTRQQEQAIYRAGVTELYERAKAEFASKHSDK